MPDELPNIAADILQKNRRHRILTGGLLSCGAGIVVNAWVRAQVRNGFSAQNARFRKEEVDASEAKAAGQKTLVVLGSPPAPSGKPTDALHQRLLTAAIVAGRNPSWKVCVTGIGFGKGAETPLMESILLDEGIAKDRLIVDPYSLRTYDSVFRAIARDVQLSQGNAEELPELVFVSQRFHVERAIYLARSLGAKASGVSCAGRNGKIKDRIREHGARVRAFVDVNAQMPPSYSVAKASFES
ncbi:MAG: hypothetical protein GY822_06605 [Deltaproteobacteria bacterium]|nr:hypothetical protein [Deltaproteobacteria bacterium]